MVVVGLIMIAKRRAAAETQALPLFLEVVGRERHSIFKSLLEFMCGAIAVKTVDLSSAVCNSVSWDSVLLQVALCASHSNFLKQQKQQQQQAEAQFWFVLFMRSLLYLPLSHLL